MIRLIQIVFDIIQKYFFRYSIYEWISIKCMVIRSFWLRSLFLNCHSSVHFGRIGKLHGAKCISLAKGTFFHDYFFLTAWPEKREDGVSPSMLIGEFCDIGAFSHFSCIDRIELGNHCLIGKWVTILDNNHGDSTADNLRIPPIYRKIKSKGAVMIGSNVWIGDKVTILPGVSIGQGAVIAANSVVTKNIPAYSVAAGCPAKVVKKVIDA